METLAQKHEEYLARVKANGGRTLTFIASCCGKTIEDVAAPRGQTFDSMFLCPHCNALLWKVATDSEIKAYIAYRPGAAPFYDVPVVPAQFGVSNDV